MLRTFSRLLVFMYPARNSRGNITACLACVDEFAWLEGTRGRLESADRDDVVQLMGTWMEMGGCEVVVIKNEVIQDCCD